jgi:hypothetical protein
LRLLTWYLEYVNQICSPYELLSRYFGQLFAEKCSEIVINLLLLTLLFIRELLFQFGCLKRKRNQKLCAFCVLFIEHQVASKRIRYLLANIETQAMRLLRNRV